MSSAIDNLQAAQRQAMAARPAVGGFPVLAETLRRAGVRRNIWTLPSAQSLYLTDEGPAIYQGVPLITGTVDVATFDQASSFRRSEPTKPAGAPSQSSYKLPGTLAWCATSATSTPERSPTTAPEKNTTSRPTPKSSYSSCRSTGTHASAATVGVVSLVTSGLCTSP